MLTLPLFVSLLAGGCEPTGSTDSASKTGGGFSTPAARHTLVFVRPTCAPGESFFDSFCRGSGSRPSATQSPQPPTETRTTQPTTPPAPTETPAPESAFDTCPSGCISRPDCASGAPIKGNVAFDDGEKIFHVPTGEYYGITVIDPAYGERWFCTEAEAIDNGWRRSST